MVAYVYVIRPLGYQFFSNINIASMLSTYMSIEYLKTNHINNEIAKINNTLQHTSVTAEYSASVIDNVTVL